MKKALLHLFLLMGKLECSKTTHPAQLDRGRLIRFRSICSKPMFFNPWLSTGHFTICLSVSPDKPKLPKSGNWTLFAFQGYIYISSFFKLKAVYSV